MKTKDITLTAMFIALGLIMPSVFHVFGPNAGKIFLPLYYAVTLASLVLNAPLSLVVAIAVPLLSFSLTAMPSIPLLYFMLFEMVILCFAINIFKNFFSPQISILLSFLVSRTCYFSSPVTVGKLILNSNLSSVTVASMMVLQGVVGVLIQVIIIPIILKVVKKSYEYYLKKA